MANLELKFRNFMISTPFTTVGAWRVVKIGTSDSEKYREKCHVKKACISQWCIKHTELLNILKLAAFLGIWQPHNLVSINRCQLFWWMHLN